MAKVFTEVMTDIQKEEIAMVLTRRDRIVKIAQQEIKKAEGEFKSTAPKMTGELRASAKIYTKSRNVKTMKIPGGKGQRANLLNILNNTVKRRRKTAYFWTRIKLGTQRRFLQRAKGVK